MTYARLNALGVITGDPSIKTLADLKGKSIAADMASSEYQVMSIYGRSQGIVFGKDVTVVQAGPPLARTQLQAKRVEASMTWEPALTLTLRDNPAYRTIATGDQMWKAISKTTGWQLVLVMREEFLKKSPEAVPRLIKMFQEGANYLKTNVDDADRVKPSCLAACSTTCSRRGKGSAPLCGTCSSWRWTPATCRSCPMRTSSGSRESFARAPWPDREMVSARGS
jgi:ABC-type taurine transport system substrate-binding protein